MRNILIFDPDEFWEQFDEKINKLLAGKEKNTPKWMRSADVRELLNISDSTLQSMRISRALPAYKLGNTWFYKYNEIIEALNNGKIKRR
jgi:hypothetical protein